MNQITIAKKILIAYSLLLILLIAIGIAGISGVGKVAGITEYVTTKAWDAADGAMEGTIGLQAELLTMKRFLRDELSYDETIQRIAESEQFGGEALERMVNSGLFEQNYVDTVHSSIDTYRKVRDNLISQYHTFVNNISALSVQTEKLNFALEMAEDVVEANMDGDAIEQHEIAKVQKLWTYADALMETRIAILNNNQILEHAVRIGKISDEQSNRLQENFGIADELMETILESELSLVASRDGKSTIRSLIQNTYDSYPKLFGETFTNFLTYRDSENKIRVLIKSLIEQIEELEATGDSKVEQAVGEIAPVVEVANRFIIIVMIVGVLFAIAAIILLKSSIVNPIDEVVERMRQIADGDGDLTVTLSDTGKDELAQLARWFNKFIGKIHAMVRDISTTLEKLNNSTAELAHISQQTIHGIQNQSSETDQAATAMNQMSATVNEVAQNAASAANATHDSDLQAKSGYKTVTETIHSIENLAAKVTEAASVIQRLKSDSETIGSVLDVIRGIAEQTNLLALNAAIEAARAGEQGRGFAVVADEVRTLAGRTQQSTQEIQKMIEQLQSGAGSAVAVMEASQNQVKDTVNQAREAGESLSAITQAVQLINDMNTQIASAAEQQSSVTEHVNQNVHNIQSIAVQTSEGAAQIGHTASELTHLAKTLEKMVNQFRV